MIEKTKDTNMEVKPLTIDKLILNEVSRIYPTNSYGLLCLESFAKNNVRESDLDDVLMLVDLDDISTCEKWVTKFVNCFELHPSVKDLFLERVQKHIKNVQENKEITETIEVQLHKFDILSKCGRLKTNFYRYMMKEFPMCGKDPAYLMSMAHNSEELEHIYKLYIDALDKEDIQELVMSIRDITETLFAYRIATKANMESIDEFIRLELLEDPNCTIESKLNSIGTYMYLTKLDGRSLFGGAQALIRECIETIHTIKNKEHKDRFLAQIDECIERNLLDTETMNMAREFRGI